MGRAPEGGHEWASCSALLCAQGAIWAKPTWGVWWDWDPRLTTTAVLLFAFGGILALRAFVDDPVKRAVWSAVAVIVAYVDVPIVYFSVRWWNSLHQLQSTPQTVSSAFHWPLRINAFGILFLWIGLVMLRARVAALRLRSWPRLPAEPPTVAAGGELMPATGVVGWGTFRAYAISAPCCSATRSRSGGTVPRGACATGSREGGRS
jgi:hypothetical protein